MAYRRIGKNHDGSGSKSIVFEDGVEALLTAAELAALTTTAGLRALILTKTGKVVTDIHFHRNREGTIELVTGQRPNARLEDQADDPRRTR